MLCALASLAFFSGPIEFGRVRLDREFAKAGIHGRLTVAVTGKGGQQSYHVRFGDGKTTITAADPAGAMYGQLELAERVRNSGVNALRQGPIDGQPFIQERGLNIFLTLPWNYTTHNNDYDSAALMDPNRWWFKNEDYWVTLLDEMAESRLNWLDIHGCFDIGTTAFPNLYPYFVHSTQYPLVGVSTSIQASNLAQLNHVIDLAHARGIKVSMMSYSTLLSIPQNPNPPYDDSEQTAYNYTREVVELMIRGTPGLDAIGFRIGESNRSASFFNCYLEAIINSGRNIPLITRSWGTTKQQFMPLARNHSDMTVEIKYNGEQWGAPYIVAGGRSALWFSYFYEDYLSDSGTDPAQTMWPGNPAPQGGTWPSEPYKIVWQVRANGTHRIFPFYNPQLVRRSIQVMKVGTTSGYTVEPMDAYYPPSPNYYIADPANRYVNWTHQRDDLYLMMWGRLGYDPNTPDSVFDNVVAQKFGTNGPAVSAAWKTASKVVPLAYSAFCLGPDHRSHAPELEWGGNTDSYITTEAFDSQSFMSVAECISLSAVNGKDGRIPPLETAQKLFSYAAQVQPTLDFLESSGATSNPRLRELVQSMRQLVALARYYGARIWSAYIAAGNEAGIRFQSHPSVLMSLANARWDDLSNSQAALFYMPFVDVLRMYTAMYHWRDQLSLVNGENQSVLQRQEPNGFAVPYTARLGAPSTARLQWSVVGDSIHCQLPAAGLSGAWLFWKPLPSKTFFHKLPMTLNGANYEVDIAYPNCGLCLSAEIKYGGQFFRIPDPRIETPYAIVASRQAPTPYYFGMDEVLYPLNTATITPSRNSMLLICSRAQAFFNFYSPFWQQKVLEPVQRGMTLVILQQDYNVNGYSPNWLPGPPQVTAFNSSTFDPGGVLGLPVITASGILTQKFLPVAGWQIFGNGGIAKYHYGQGDIWLVQARLLQKVHIPNAAITLKMLLSLGGTAKPVVVIDAGTEAANNVTSLFIDFMNANDIPFVTIGEIAAGG